MRSEKLYTLLTEINIPVYYMEAPTGTNLPYLIYYEVTPDVLGADNIVYDTTYHYNLELYTPKKNKELENQIEKKLSDNEIYYTRGEDVFISDERIFESIFYI